MTTKEETYNPLISVIVPVYNVEKYIHRCVDSILGQTYTNLEVILVDDGSPDKCGEICDEYASADARVKVIHQENAGVSEARNAGLDACSGDYIAFVDPDDYIMPDMYEKMINQLIESEVDILVCQWQYEDIQGHQVIDPNKIDPKIYGKKATVEFAEFFYKQQYERMVVCVVWNKLYKKCVFDNVRFYGRRCEDERLQTNILSRNYNTLIIKDFLYVYCQNEDSLTHCPFNPDSLMFLDILLERVKCFESNRFIVENSKRLYCEMYISYFYETGKIGVEMRDIRDFDKTVKSLVFSNQITIKFMIRMILFRISPKLYAKICKIK